MLQVNAYMYALFLIFGLCNFCYCLGVSQTQRRKQRNVLTNDELLYDPDEDDRDQAWVEAKRKE